MLSAPKALACGKIQSVIAPECSAAEMLRQSSYVLAVARQEAPLQSVAAPKLVAVAVLASVAVEGGICQDISSLQTSPQNEKAVFHVLAHRDEVLRQQTRKCS
jgi:hypothetical protein